MDRSTLETLNHQLKRLHRVNPKLSVKLESCWATRQAEGLLSITLSDLHSDLDSTSYEEYHSLLTLYLLHRSLYGCLDKSPDYLPN